EHDFLLISRLLPITANGSRNLEDKWHYNKDAGMMVCPHGIMSFRKAKQNGGNQSKVMTYYMDTNVCQTCPLREGCYRPGAKSKTYSVIIRPPEHSSQLKLEETEYFQQRVKKRYMIEQKNSELKNKHGLARSWSNNLAGVRLQGIITIFEANMRRLVKLIDEKDSKKG
ncbi:IS5/IS1182 family transposase, partial [Schleiferilactobacillus harbinensis]|uniref:transposase n=1 Tax=Schleiferilactobacillus harbinensis TaxID=304207 RepID=UPI0021A4C902